MRSGSQVLRRQTSLFIDDNPTDLVLVRSVKTSDGAGGFRTTATPLPAQRVRIIEQSAGAAQERKTVSGEVTTPDYVVIGLPEVDIEDGDTWDEGAITYEVVYVRREKSYEVWAEVKASV